MVENRLNLSEGLLIAALPAAGYWFAYLYELGFCTFFNLPAHFIDIDIPVVLGAMVTIFFVVLTISVIGDLPFTILSSLPYPIGPIIRRIGLAFLMMAGFAMVAKISLMNFLIFLFPFLVLFAFYHFVSPLISEREAIGYIAKVEAHYKRDLSRDYLMDVMAKKIGREWFKIIFLLMLFSFGSYFIGGYQAKTKINFMLLPGPPELVVLKHFKTWAVVTSFNRNSRGFSPEYQLISVDNNLGKFRYEPVGPLIPNKTKK